MVYANGILIYAAMLMADGNGVLAREAIALIHGMFVERQGNFVMIYEIVGMAKGTGAMGYGMVRMGFAFSPRSIPRDGASTAIRPYGQAVATGGRRSEPFGNRLAGSQ